MVCFRYYFVRGLEFCKTVSVPYKVTKTKHLTSVGDHARIWGSGHFLSGTQTYADVAASLATFQLQK